MKIWNLVFFLIFGVAQVFPRTVPTYLLYLGKFLKFPDIKAVFSLTGFRSFVELGHR